jgi:hypothetical protein
MLEIMASASLPDQQRSAQFASILEFCCEL